MGIIWLILKVLLGIVLALLAILILVVILLLTLPIDYFGDFEKYDQMNIQSRIKFFYILSIIYEFKEEKSIVDFRVFGKQLNKASPSLKEVEKVTKEGLEDLMDVEKKVAKQTTLAFPSQEEKGKQIKEKVDAEPKKNEQKIKYPQEMAKEEDKEDKPLKQKTKEEPKEDKSDRIKRIVEQVTTLWQSEYKKGFIKAIKKMFIQLARAIKPERIRFNLVIGRGDPSETGELLAIGAIFYPIYAKYGNLQGDFEREGVWGDIEVKGRLRLYRLIKPLFLVLINKSVRNYVKIILNLRKEEKNGISIK